MRSTSERDQLQAGGTQTFGPELGMTLAGYHFWRDLTELLRVTVRYVRPA